MKKFLSIFLSLIIMLSVFPTSTVWADTIDDSIITALNSSTNIKSDSDSLFYIGDNTTSEGVAKSFKLTPSSSQYYNYCLFVSSSNKNVQFTIANAVDLSKKTYNILLNKNLNTSTDNYEISGVIYLNANVDYYIIVTETNVNEPDENTSTENTLSIYKHNHSFSTKTESGKKFDYCKTCGYKRFYQKPNKYSLSTTSYTYNGKARKPTVTVKNSKGSKISSSYYKVTYSGNRKNVGKYKVTITMNKYPYYGSKTLYFTIKPKSTSISKLSAGKKKFTVKWKKQATQTTGYQIQYSTSNKFSSKTTKTINITKNKTTKKTISKLKSKKKYYVRIRTYKNVKVNGKSTKIYSSWSKIKNIKTK